METCLPILPLLDIIDLIRCGQLSKRIRAISSDERRKRKRLFLNGIKINYNIINQVILHNGKALTILNLRNCKGLSVYGVNPGLTPYKVLVKNCVELREFNLESTNLSRDSLNFLANNLTPTIEKLSLQNLKHLQDKHVSTIVKRCNKIRILDLSHTSIESVVNIVHYLNSTLEEIDVNRTNVPRTKILDLKLIPTLIVLNHGFGLFDPLPLNGFELSGFIQRKVDVAC